MRIVLRPLSLTLPAVGLILTQAEGWRFWAAFVLIYAGMGAFSVTVNPREED